MISFAELAQPLEDLPQKAQHFLSCKIKLQATLTLNESRKALLGTDSVSAEQVFRENKKVWASILEHRVNGNFDYPHNLDRSITSLHKNLRLEYQYFTDSKSIAEGYAKKVGGLLIEMTVPFKDVIEHFEIEFQNFGRRKKIFEIVYCVKGSVLSKRGKKWKLTVRKKK